MESEREGGEGRRGLAVRGLEGGREPKLASPLCANSYSSSTPATRLPLQPDPPIQIHLRHWSITLVTDTATKRSHRTPLVRHSRRSEITPRVEHDFSTSDHQQKTI